MLSTSGGDAVMALLQAPAPVLSPTLIGIGFAQAIVYLLFIRFVDVYERESFWYVLPVFVWGFAVATTVSLIFNTIAAVSLSNVVDQQTAGVVTAVLVAPPVEETSKGLAVFIVFAIASLVSRARGGAAFSGVMDGIVFGSAVGFGFSIAEDILYYAQAGPETFVVRRIFGGFAHAAFTSLTGIGVGLIPWVRSPFLKVLLPAVGLLSAILLHAAFNLTATLFGPLAYLVLVLVLLVYVVLILAWLAVERRTIRDELRDEVSAGTISQREYEIMPTYFGRTGYYLGLVFSGRLTEWRLARRVHRMAVDLAFTKRLSRITHAAPQESRAERLRREISDLHGARRVGGPGFRP
jgi:RsiW-degrading membrane proteinase PrsW (M82 family)